MMSYPDYSVDASGFTWEESARRVAAGTHPLVRSLRSDWLDDSPVESSPPTTSGISALDVAAAKAEGAASAAAALSDTSTVYDPPPRFLLGDSPVAAKPPKPLLGDSPVAAESPKPLLDDSPVAAKPPRQPRPLMSPKPVPKPMTTPCPPKRDSYCGSPPKFCTLLEYSETPTRELESPTITARRELYAGLVEVLVPPVERLSEHLTELGEKQNKILHDLTEENRECNNDSIAELHDMMNNVQIYRDKLVKIKKQMQNIYQRTKSLKKRAETIQACKERELQRKLRKQKQEEALIGQVL